MCQALLEESNIDSAVRLGDIYGLMIEWFARKEKWQAVRKKAINEIFTSHILVVMWRFINRGQVRGLTDGQNRRRVHTQVVHEYETINQGKGGWRERKNNEHQIVRRWKL